MIDTLFHIIDNIFFFCIALSGIYLFIFALAALFRHSGKYPITEKRHRFALLVPSETDIKNLEYPKDLYTVLTYSDLLQAVRELDEKEYNITVILGETAHVSPLLLQDINNAYDAGAVAMQLHHIIECRPTRKIHWQAIHEEIRNSIFRQGHVQCTLSSALDKMDIAIDSKWLKQNLKSPKSNLESRLLQQNIFIEYLSDAHVYSNSPRPRPYSMSKWKAVSKLPATLMEGNWDYADKLFRQFIPSWKVLLFICSICCVIVTCYNWTLSPRWWLLLFGLLFTVCMAIPDYLVEKKKK
ncbi:hypothetical protein [Bacteroides sp.]